MTKVGDALHRAFFTLVSHLPAAGSRRLLGGYFDWWHRRPDPWHYTTDRYERDRHSATLRRLPRRDYRRILDVGCSEGTFTDLLAASFPEAETIGVDISSHAVRAAAARRASKARFLHLDIRHQAPEGLFDLAICSEMLYYVGDAAMLRQVSRRLRELLAPGGLLALAHPWPEARRLHRHFTADAGLEALGEHVVLDRSRPYAIALYQRRPFEQGATVGSGFVPGVADPLAGYS
ncbi:trans-aconitate methyltransferase [Thermocatellispora tengchongensis]|uniref:Trans-aconitate methyltransferase n=1 Tax=Thermocatellispora tengchongensis TaxID=1073253 RepID=A0A840P988_9ACTN|nr:class I SAM-dependent methyltransferase [Thermocatellispora tengchongensis]MBB5137944.1 trans-aconitate methyltransferase [Thermocatellispora tengchongensis]